MSNTAAIAHTGYVVTDSGKILVQTPENNLWGFSLQDDDQSWPGGFGIAQSWDAIEADDPRITPAVRERLQWILDELA